MSGTGSEPAGKINTVNGVIFSGTLGTGKTALMWALGHELTEQGQRSRCRDVDCPRGLIRPTEGNRFKRRIVLAHLRAMIPLA
jgi:chromosomal replication initiation ATPase DnaA